MIRVLHVVSVMDRGGMESYIMNLYRHMDRTQIQFDFLVHHNRCGAYEDEIRKLGGNVYHTDLIDNGNLLWYCRSLRQLFREHPEYRIVHGHLGSTAYWYLGAAEKQGVPWRILHSHCPGRVHTVKGAAKHLLFYLSPAHANIRWACSEQAGRYQFKKQAFEVMPNGIDVERFGFDPQTRQRIRKELGLDGRFVIGHVGRFCPEKNHELLLRIFQEVRKRIPKAALMLIGDGPNFLTIKEACRQMGLASDVHFLGLQQDVAPFYQAMDVFVLPSCYEGFSLTSLEAQAAGLQCLLTSNTSVQAKLSDRCVLLPVHARCLPEWSNALFDIYQNQADRAFCPEKIWPYDAKNVARDVFKEYQTLLERRP